MDAAPPPGTLGYNRVAHALLAKRLPFEQVHRHIFHLFPTEPARILDVGSGPGHDAATLSARGHTVTAVEPTPELRKGAQTLYAHLPIDWIDDSLPRLARLRRAHRRPFDFILVEGVWAHLTEAERMEAFPILVDILAEEGILAISLRHGPAALGRVTYPVTAAETEALAAASRLAVLVSVQAGSIQPSNIASGVTWTRMAFRRR